MPPSRSKKNFRSMSKNAPARRKRGTTGLDKHDRVKKNNALSDFYAAKKHLTDLKQISDSSSSDLSEGESFHSSDEETQKKNDPLAQLRGLLGVTSDEIEAANDAKNPQKFSKKNLAQEASTLEDLLELDEDEELFGGDDDEDDEGFDADDEDEDDDKNAKRNKKNKKNGDLDGYVDDEDEEDDEEMFDGEAGGDLDEYVEENDDDEEILPFEEGSEGDMADPEEVFFDEEGEWEIAEEDQEKLLETDDDDDDGDDEKEKKKNRGDKRRQLQDAENEVIYAAQETDKADLFWLKFIDNIFGKPDETQPEVNEGFAFSDNNQKEVKNVSVSFSEKALKNLRTVRMKEQQQQNEENNNNNKKKNNNNKKSSGSGNKTLGYIHDDVVEENFVKFSNSTNDQKDENNKNSVLLSSMRLFSSYADVSLYTRTWDNESDICRAYACHCVNHLQKAQSVMNANDALLLKTEQDESSSHNKKNQNDNEQKTEKESSPRKIDASQLQVRDRGFTRPRILVLFPLRSSALRFMKHISECLGLNFEQEFKRSSFVSDFSEMEEAKDPTFKRRAYDFQKQFDGNINDTFCFGVTLSNNNNSSQSNKNNKNQKSAPSVSVYVPFLESDMIVASPVGLRKRLLKEGNLAAALSSIEVLIIDEAQVILMQNWSHVDAIFGVLNKRPTDTTEGLNDVNRIYNWALLGQSRRHRQTIIVSAFANVAFTRTLRESCCNNSGKIVVTKTFGTESTDGSGEGVIAKTPTGIRQHFVRLRTESLAQVDDARFEYFTKSWFPTKIQPLVDQNVRTILFVPSYFDFARLRTWLNEQHRFSFAVICEHSTQKEQRQALGQFSDQERCLLVMTERFYFFRRYFVREAEVCFFYSPPLVNFFYSDIVGKLNTGSPHCQSQTLFCRYDVHEMSRVVGAERTKQMLTRPADAYMLVNSVTNNNNNNNASSSTKKKEQNNSSIKRK